MPIAILKGLFWNKNLIEIAVLGTSTLLPPEILLNKTIVANYEIYIYLSTQVSYIIRT